MSDSQVLSKDVDVTWRFIAHRGANNDAPGNILPHFPENTLVSLQEAFAKGARYVECDVHLTADNKIVVIHDDTLRRTARYSPTLAINLTEPHFQSILDKKIPDLSYVKELSQVDVGSYADFLDAKRFHGTPIPLLENFLEALQGDPARHLVIELKAGDQHIAAAVTNLITSYVKKTSVLANQLLFISFDFEVIKSLKKQLPDYKCLFLTIASPDPDEIKMGKNGLSGQKGLYYRIKDKNDLDYIIQQVKEAHLDGLDVEFNSELIDTDFIKRIHKNGLLCAVWNYRKDDTLETAKYLLNVNADLMNTNQPEYLFNELTIKK